MVRWIATVTGVLVSGALFYQFRRDIDSNSVKIRKHLHETQERLEASLPGHKRTNIPPPSEPGPIPTPPNARPQVPFLSWSDARHHVSTRILPTTKAMWNEHIAAAAKSLHEFDVRDATMRAKGYAEKQGWLGGGEGTNE